MILWGWIVNLFKKPNYFVLNHDVGLLVAKRDIYSRSGFTILAIVETLEDAKQKIKKDKAENRPIYIE